jgi:putative SOS response-associated peptidase YedK
MCGKFTAMASWSEVFSFSQPLFALRDGNEDGGGDGSNDGEVTYGVAKLLPVIVWDAEAGKRKIVPMRWGFPSPKDWRRPQPIHARSEGIDSTRAFAGAFRDGQRGIVVFKTFNEGEEVLTSGGKPKTIQWTIDPGDGIPRGFAFVWRRFEIPDLPQPMLACCMVTVPASELIRRTIMANQDDPRMPAILEDADWATWLGETPATPDQAKAVLKTMEDVTWKMAPEQKKPARRGCGAS